MRRGGVRAVAAHSASRRKYWLKEKKKTQKRRTITLSQSLKNDIRKTYNQLQPPMDGFIFQYSLQHTNVLLKEGGKDCKIRNKNISTHSFRKSGGRYVWNSFGCSDESLIKLSLLLNHSSTSITRRYLSIQKEEIEDILILNGGRKFTWACVQDICKSLGKNQSLNFTLNYEYWFDQGCKGERANFFEWRFGFFFQ